MCVLGVVSSLLFKQCKINPCSKHVFSQNLVFSKTILPVGYLLNYVAMLSIVCEPSVLASLTNFTVIHLLGLFLDTDGVSTRY